MKKSVVFITILCMLISIIVPGVAYCGSGGNTSTPTTQGNTTSGAVAAAAPLGDQYFILSTDKTNPGKKVTLEYRFKAQLEGHYFMHFADVETAINESSYDYKDLDSERKNGYIFGTFTITAPTELKNFEFRVFGPKDNSYDYKNQVTMLIKEQVNAAKSASFVDSAKSFAKAGADLLKGVVNEILDVFGLGDKGKVQCAFLLASAPVENRAYTTFISAPGTANPLQPITVSFEDASAYSTSWLGLFKYKEGNSPISAVDAIYTKPLNGLEKGELEIKMPSEYGRYLVCAFMDAGYKNVIGKSAVIAVDKSSPTFSGVKVTVAPFQTISANYQGAPNQINAKIGIYPEKDTTGDTMTWKDLMGKTSGSYIATAPNEEGNYVFRIYDDQNRLLGTSAVFRVVGSAETMSTKDAATGVVLFATPGDGCINLSWPIADYSDPENFVGFNLYRGTASGKENTVVTDFPISGRMYTDYRVKNGIMYYYILKPVYKGNKEGNGYNEVSAMPLAQLGSIVLVIGNPMMKVNGSEVEIDPGKGTKPLIIKGRTFIPIRALIETMGGTVTWNGEEQKVTLGYNSKTVDIIIGKDTAKVNGEEKGLDSPAYISDTGRTMLPLRFVVENLGCDVTWDGPTQSITVKFVSAGSGTITTAPGTTAPAVQTPAVTNSPMDKIKNDKPPVNVDPIKVPVDDSGWTGKWKDIKNEVLLVLVQDEATITGTYNDNTVLVGTLSDKSLSGTTITAALSGLFNLEITDDGSSIKGRLKLSDNDEWIDMEFIRAD